MIQGYSKWKASQTLSPKPDKSITLDNVSVVTFLQKVTIFGVNNMYQLKPWQLYICTCIPHWECLKMMYTPLLSIEAVSIRELDQLVCNACSSYYYFFCCSYILHV